MDSGLIRRLAPIAAVIFVAFGVVGLAMPVLPLHVHQRLGMTAFVVGLVSGSQFTASLISRASTLVVLSAALVALQILMRPTPTAAPSPATS